MGIYSLFVAVTRPIHTLIVRNRRAARIGAVIGACFMTSTALAVPPTASSVSISGTPEVSFTLSGSYVYSDLDGDAEGTSTFRWLRNGAPIAGATGQNYTLVGADVGAFIVFEVTPVALTGLPGEFVGNPVQSGSVGPVAPANTAPTATSVTATGPAEVGFQLSGGYTYNDADGDLEGASTFRWLRNGSPIGGATGQNYTLVNADVGANIRFEVTPVAQSGVSPGNPVTSGPVGPIAPANTPPTATNVTAAGTAEVGFQLSGSYTYNDADGDLEGTTTFRWLRNGAPIGGATGQNYTLAAGDVGAIVRFEVTPVALAGISPGTPVVSNPIGPIAPANTAPQAQSVSIGGNPAIGENLTGSYTYFDADGDAESGTTFRWLRNGGAISGATGTNYTVVGDDVGTTLAFEVTPRAATGVSPGTPATAQVDINNTPPTITGQQPLATDEETALTLELADFTATDPDNVFPDDFTLLVQNGSNYSRNGNTITPAVDFVGDLTVGVRVNDGVSDSPTFNATVSVAPVNDQPAIVGQQDIVIAEDSMVTIVIGDLVVADPDNAFPADFTFELQDGNDYVRAGNTITPSANFNGDLTVPVTVNDGELTSDVFGLTVEVTPENDLPTLVTPVGAQNAVEASLFQLSIAANFDDVDGETLTYSASGLPASGTIQFDEQTGEFSGTPVFEDTEPSPVYSIVVTATDAAGAFATDTFDLTIAALGRANVSLGIDVAPTPALVNDQLQWTFTASNPVGPEPATNVQLTGSFVGSGLTVTADSTNCTVQAAVGDSTGFTCDLGGIAVGGTSAVVLSTVASAVGHVNVFATAVGLDPIPIDPNPDDNSLQTATGVAEIFSNGAVETLGTADVRSLATGDINGDGATDIVVGTVAGQSIQVFLSDGFRSFTAAAGVADTDANEGLALADFDGNGTLDLAVANGAGTEDRVYANDGAGNFTLTATLGASQGQAIAAGDFDDDGNADVAVATALGNPIYRGDGSGGFAMSAMLGTANSIDVAAAEFDGDLRDDLVFANASGNSQVWISNGAGFDAGSALNIGGVTSVVVAEFGGDARPDLAFGRRATALGDIPANPILINDGNGQFGAPAETVGMAPTLDIQSGDVNRDGLADLIFVNGSGVHQIWLATAAGFELYREQIADLQSTTGVVAELGVVEAGDNGGTDLALGGFSQAGVGVFLNDGDGNLGFGDGVAPTLALLGEATINIASGAPYTDPGATAQDNIDGDISSAIVVTNTVNTAVVGTYTVTYNVSDLAGNAADPISRTVQVNPASGSGGGGGALSYWVLALLACTALLVVEARRRVLARRRIRITQRKDPFA